ncbi:baseplate J/gp47 family protein [Variovorax paradoxus]|uniref:baseplate J/gp47 family protein n=1 Tax=Variovorax paradoxus TaxID=34073 RepID=UPI001ABD35C8
MPFERPTLPELIDQGATEIESRLPGLLVRVRRSLVGVINRVVAAGLATLYQYAEYLNRQAWPDTCDPEYLDQHGARWGVSRTNAAAATGTANFTGVNGAVLPAGSQVQRSDGQLYATTVEAAIAAGFAAVPVAALVPGQAGNASIGVSLTLTSPVIGVSTTATAATALAGGADVEGAEPYRARILARVRQAPHGGADFDYVAWAKEVPGVTRVWVYPGEQGAGTVVVRFARDNDASPIPDAGEVAAVQAHFDRVRPVTATVIVVAPIAAPINWTISLTPDTPSTRQNVAAELAAMIRRDAIPGGTILKSRYDEAVSIAPGEFDHEVLSPPGNVVFTTGQMATMGPITWD